MSKFFKNARKWTGLEQLENRITPAIQFGFETVTAPDGASYLFFRIQGDDANNVVTLDTTNNGNVQWSATFEEGGGVVEASGVITSGDFANAAGLNNFVSIGGFHVVGGAGHDTINASEFDDPATQVLDDKSTRSGGLTNYRLWAQGGDGNDTIAGGFRSDWLQGENNNDTLVIAMGVNDFLSGGTKGETGNSNPGWFTSGADRLLIGTGEAITVGGRTVNNTDIERITGSSEGETIDNRNFDDDGRGVNVDAMGGNDTVVSSQFADRLVGGLPDGLADVGGDTLSYAGSKTGVQVNLAGSPHIVSGGNAAGDNASQFENVTGSDFNDILIGSSSANILTGGAGNDELSGASGNDRLLGGDGHDAMEGGLGNDTMEGGTGDDTMEGGIGSDNMTGGDGNDTIDAGAGTDTINLNFQELDPADANATHGGLNDADAFFGGPTGDLFVFFNIPDNADGDLSEAAINSTVQYLDDQLDDGMNDWDETLDSIDWVGEPD